MCTGSLINKRWALTAAHCLLDDDSGEVTTPQRIAMYAYYEVDSYKPISVQNVTIHPRYTPETSENVRPLADLGMVQTKKELDLGSAVLQTDPDYYPTGVCEIAGFGLKIYHELGLPTLHRMELQTLRRNVCGEVVEARTLCALQVAGLGPCIGDSGSPLVCADRLAGVLSSAVLQQEPLCGDPATNGILFYEPVAAHLAWVEEAAAWGGQEDRTTGVPSRAPGRTAPWPLLVLLLT